MKFNKSVVQKNPGSLTKNWIHKTTVWCLPFQSQLVPCQQLLSVYQTKLNHLLDQVGMLLDMPVLQMYWCLQHPEHQEAPHQGLTHAPSAWRPGCCLHPTSPKPWCEILTKSQLEEHPRKGHIFKKNILCQANGSQKTAISWPLVPSTTPGPPGRHPNNKSVFLFSPVFGKQSGEMPPTLWHMKN